jgi:phosphate butyryltransferase
MRDSIKGFKELIESAVKKGPKKIAVAAAEDKHVLQAVKLAKEYNLIEPILIGSIKLIEKLSKEINFDLSKINIINIENREDVAYKAAELADRAEIDLIMKGLIDTSIILKMVLCKDFSLKNDRMLSHVGVLTVKGFDRFFILSDSAMNIKPSIEDKKAIIVNAVYVANALGIDNPKVALVCPVEKVNSKIESTVDAYEITNWNKKGIIKGCIIGGPLALDNAISIEAAKIKGISDPVAGCADILIPPDLVSANILNKSMEYFAGAEKAGVIIGASIPIVLTSRASSAKAKLNSIALGVLCSDSCNQV